MAKKTTAAVLLLVVAAWAEMTMAPMLAMHAGHMRPGHEMAVDMPAEHSAHHRSAHPQSEDAQMDAERPCCPGHHKMETADVSEVVSGAPACDDPHSCCFRQGPQSVPTLARSVQRRTREATPVAAVETGPERGTAEIAISSIALILHSPPDVFGMTLRV
ncbi:MAG: hypothetical protein WA172_20390 [Terriglobales bacterium]